MSDSIWNDPRITAYVLDELSEDDRKLFEIELEGSAELQAAVAEARSVTGRLEDLFAAESTPGLDEDRRKTIVTPTPSSSWSWRTPMVVLATAASLLLLVGGPMWLNRQQPMILGQASDQQQEVASDEELMRYGKEQVKGPPLEGLAVSEFESAQSDFAPQAITGVSPPKQSASDSELRQWSARGRRQEAVDISSRQSGATRENANADTNAVDSPVVAGGRITLSEQSLMESAKSPQQPAPNQLGLEVGLKADDGGAEPQDAIRVRFAESKKESNELFGVGQAGQRAMQKAAERQQRSQLHTLPSVETLVRPMLRNDPRLKSEETSKDFDEASFGEFDDLESADGIGPGFSGDKFQPITDNPFKRVSEHPMSTFSVDVDTASYSKTRDFLSRTHQLPRPDAVRIEEMVNYFDYDYQPPTADDEHPFATHTVVTSCPWNNEHRLARIALKGKLMEAKERPQCNLVFLLDTSGSMNQPNKLPLVVDGMKMLLKQLDEKDRVAVTVYAGSAGLVLDSTPAKKKKKIRKALTQLSAGGSTNGGAGIALAYQTARDNFIDGGVNRVILCTDGDFNVGTTGTDSLVRMVQKEAQGGIFLTVLGFGMGNHNDAMLEQISGSGNGNYAFIDNVKEARKVLVDQTNATLVTIAKDVKLQIEFNPKQVSSYRLIGYENRILAKEDFNDDKKDAGEIGAGHAVTALYEIVPAGVEADASRPKVDALKYQSESRPTEAADSDETMTLKLRYKAPDGDTSTLVQFPVTDKGTSFDEADPDVRFAAAVAGFGMQLRRSEYKGSWTLSDVKAIAESSQGEDKAGLRKEFVELVSKASELMGEE